MPANETSSVMEQQQRVRLRETQEEQRHNVLPPQLSNFQQPAEDTSCCKWDSFRLKTTDLDYEETSGLNESKKWVWLRLFDFLFVAFFFLVWFGFQTIPFLLCNLSVTRWGWITQRTHRVHPLSRSTTNPSVLGSTRSSEPVQTRTAGGPQEEDRTPPTWAAEKATTV